MIYGADVSNWQGSYTWPSGLKFGFAKATEGTTFTDGQFAHNWAQMKAKGLVRGAYHFGHPKNDPVIEAEHFLTVVRARGLHDGDLLALDLEISDGRSASAVAAWARKWCAHVQQRTGIRPVLYTFLSFARGGYCAGLGAYPLWIADPSSPAGKPRVAGPWKSWAIHQYSDSPYDKDVSHLTVAQLRALGGGAPEEDDVPIRSSYSLTKAEPIPWSTQTVLAWQVENADPSNAHSGQNPGYVAPVASWADMLATITIDGLDKTRGDEWQITYQVHNWDDSKGKSTSSWTECGVDIAATEGHQFGQAAFSKGLSKHQHIYVAVTVYPGDDDTSRPAPTVTYGRWTVAQDKA